MATAGETYGKRGNKPALGRIAAPLVLVALFVAGLGFREAARINVERGIARQASSQCDKSRDNAACQSAKAEIRSALAAEHAVTLGIWQTAFNFFGLIGLFLTVLYARRAWLAARDSAEADNKSLAEARATSEEARRASAAGEEANRISREALIADQRPWIALSDIGLTGPITFHPQNGWRIDLVFRMKNVGRTPALNVIPNIQAFVSRDMNVSEVHRQFSEHMRALADRSFGQVVFPDQPSEQGVSTDITIDEFALAREFGEGQRVLHPTILGAITYQTTGGTTHVTAFRLTISDSQDRLLVVPGAPVDGHALDNLRLRRDLMGWFAD